MPLMIIATGYDVRQVIYEDAAIMVCHAMSKEHACEVLLKVVKDGPRAVIENAKVLNEYEVAGSLDIPGILKPIALLREGNRLMLASEWVNGFTLRHYAAGGPVTVPVFLKLAIRITEVLERLHRAHMVHMNIRPDTIVVVPSTMEVRLTGLGHAVYTTAGGRQARQMPLVEASPPYMAPERTGQLEGVIDAGTDLYSLGVTLYELLAGRLPFEAKDPLEWAHAHVAKVPLPMPSGTPPLLEQVLRRLLEKSVSRRYRSAFGLRADLERCERLLEEHGWLLPFELGTEDPLEQHLVKRSPGGAAGEPEQTGHDGYVQILDLAAVMRASQAFAEEKDSWKLLARLMRILMEISGAQKGVLTAVRSHSLYAVLEVQAEQQEPQHLGGQSLEESRAASEAILRYAVHQGALLLVSDAGSDLRFAGDPYIRLSRPKSVMGLPVIAQGELQGVLYLENNYTTGVFQTVREPVLHMLASQISSVYMMMGYFSGPASEAAALPEQHQAPNLTDREIDVLQGMADGLSNKEIASRLLMSAGTVKVHVRNLFDKLQVNNRTKAVTMAAKLNVLVRRGG
jgi:serine/threonine protein kinase/DNA-binding CsgD family transcriptional regulator